MSLGRSQRFAESKRDSPILARQRWHGALLSTLGKNALSRVRSSPSLKFGKSGRSRVKAVTKKHAYDVPLSTLSRQSSAKWPTRDQILAAESKKRKKEAALKMTPYQQYPGEVPGTFGSSAVKLSRIPSSPSVSIKHRPPTSLITPEQLKNTSHHIANSYSTFGKQKLGRTRGAPAVAIARAKEKDRLPVVSPIAQYPAGQVSTFGHQALSTVTQSSRASIARRGEINPIPRQWTDVGPGAYMPPSTFSSAGVKFPAHQPVRTRRARTASSTTRRRGKPVRTPGTKHEFGSVKEWLAAHEKRPSTAASGGSGSVSAAAAATAAVARPSTAAMADAEPQSLSDWLETYGKPSRGSMFKSLGTRRPKLTRGLSMGSLRMRQSAASPRVRELFQTDTSSG